MEDCQDGNKGFGIVAKVGREISSVGCYVNIFSILKKYDNGEYDIIVEGLQRFSVNKIDIHERGYYTADVYDYPDDDKNVDQNLILEIKNKFEGVLKKINLELEDAFWNNFINSETKSFKIAEKSGLTINEQQELLMLQDENKRLEYLRDHFKKLDEQLSVNLSKKVIIMNDGFVN